MAYNSLLRVLAVKHSGHASNLTEGEVREVLPVDHVPSRHEKMQFLYIKSEMTVADAKAYWLKSGVPDEVVAAWDAELDQVQADREAVIAGNKAHKDIHVPDQSKNYSPDDYPSRLRYIDLTKVNQTHLGRCQAGLQAIIDNRSAAYAKATEKVLAKYSEQLGRALSKDEKKLTIEVIQSKNKVDKDEKDKTKIEKLDRQFSEIALAATAGKHEVDYAAFDDLDEPAILEHTDKELEGMTLTN